MSKKKQTENEELFGILSDTINGANYDDLNDAVYRILIANYHKQREGEWVLQEGCNRLVKCTACGYEYTDVVECTNYCGNCGAKMKGGE